MGELLERSNLGKLVFGAGTLENYKNNSLYFLQKYKESDDIVKSINPKNLEKGGFYFLHYLDDSNWMKYAPIFAIEKKQCANVTIVYGLNFNFLPIEIRISVFDKYITENDFEKDRFLPVDFDRVYKELRSYGFEYGIVEFNLAQIKLAHKIHMEFVPRFLYSGHPQNVYDPKKLYSIWTTKVKNRDKRDDDMAQYLLDDFLKLEGEFKDSMNSLKKHAERVRKSMEKYG